MSKKKLRENVRILVDMDGCLNEFNPYLASLIEAEGYKMHPLSKWSWKLVDNIDESLSNTKKWKIIHNILDQESFWTNIPPKKGVVPILKDLNDTQDIVIVTAPWERTEEGCLRCMSGKLSWINKHIPIYDTDKVIFSRKKWEIPGDYIIDDKPEYLEKFRGKKVAFDYPYNQGVVVDYRVNDWFDVEDYFAIEGLRL